MNRAIAGPRPRALRPAKLKRERNPGFSAGKKKRPNKWRLNRPHGQERSLVKREMALAEVRRREAAKKLFPFRPQLLRTIFTVPRRTALTLGRLVLPRCYAAGYGEYPAQNLWAKWEQLFRRFAPPNLGQRHFPLYEASLLSMRT